MFNFSTDWLSTMQNLRKNSLNCGFTFRSVMPLIIRHSWAAPCKDVASGVCGHQRLSSARPAQICTNGEQRPGWDFAHVQNDVSLYVLRMLEATFSLGEAHMVYHLMN